MAIGKTNVGGGAGLPAGWSEKATGIRWVDLEKDQPVELRRMLSFDTGFSYTNLPASSALSYAHFVSSENGEWIANQYSSGYNTDVFHWDGLQYLRIATFAFGNAVLQAISNDGLYFVSFSGGTAGFLSVYSRTGTTFAKLKDIRSWSGEAAMQTYDMFQFSKDDAYLYCRYAESYSNNGQHIYRWNVSAGAFDNAKSYFTGNGGTSTIIDKMKLSSDGLYVYYRQYVSGGSYSIRCLSTLTMTSPTILIAQSSTATTATFSNDGQYLYAYGLSPAGYFLFKLNGTAAPTRKITFTDGVTFGANEHACFSYDGLYLMRYDNSNPCVFKIDKLIGGESISQIQLTSEILDNSRVFPATPYLIKFGSSTVIKCVSGQSGDFILPTLPRMDTLSAAFSPDSWYGIGRMLNGGLKGTVGGVELFKAYNDAVRGGMQQMMAMAAMLPGADEKILELEYQKLLLEGGLEL